VKKNSLAEPGNLGSNMLFGIFSEDYLGRIVKREV